MGNTDESIKIMKPKKNIESSTYEAAIVTGNRKPYMITIPKISIVDMKVGNQDSYIYLKYVKSNRDYKKQVVQKFFELNSRIIDCVKANCTAWFKNSLSDELIEDYYSSNISYDKKHGQVFKFKCINDISAIPIGQIANIKLVLQNIRFYKQKFVLEWEITEVELLKSYDGVDMQSDTSDDEVEECDIPAPTYEELESIKKEYIVKLSCLLQGIENKIGALQNRRDKLVYLHDKIESLAMYDEFYKLSNDIDDVLESNENI